MNENMVKNEANAIEYVEIKVKSWYSTNDELFFGQVKVCLPDVGDSIAVISAGKNMQEMMEKLRHDYSSYVYGFNMAMAITGGKYRLKYPTEDDSFIGFIK